LLFNNAGVAQVALAFDISEPARAVDHARQIELDETRIRMAAINKCNAALMGSLTPNLLQLKLSSQPAAGR
jgi:hypothetical protein